MHIIPLLISLFIYSQNINFEENKILQKEIKINIPISGITQAYDEYDIKATFDGYITHMLPSLFDVVVSSQPLAKLVTAEVYALLKTAKDETEKKEILKRWKGLFKYIDITAPYDGIVTRIYVKPNSSIVKGDKIMTIARKMRLIAKNDAELYMTPEKELNGIVEKIGLGRYKITLKDFFATEKKYFYKLLFDFEKIPDIKIGEKVEGTMIVAQKTSARVVPTSDIIEYNGRKYLIIEFEPGIITSTFTEISGFKFNYLKILK